MSNETHFCFCNGMDANPLCTEIAGPQYINPELY